MTHNFAQVPSVETPRSSFDRSTGYKTAFDSGYLIPIFVDEVIPGDTHNLNMTAIARLATPLRPFMDNLFMDTHFFFVPTRLVWENFQRFMGEKDNPSDSTDYLVPVMETPGVGGYGAETIYDYMGIPPDIENIQPISLPMRCYNLIYNEWYRDQNLQDSVAMGIGDGPDAENKFTLLKRGKRHDYFTSCLPWPQKGDSVDLPLGEKARITGLGNTGTSYPSSPTSVNEAGGVTRDYTDAVDLDPGSFVYMEEDPDHAGHPGIYADLSTATAASINQIRQAFQMQRLLERDARGGTRYTEIIRSHFGVVSPDQRLQRPEYLGGGSSPINLNIVAQTTADTFSGRAMGDLAAYGETVLRNHGFTKSFTEHGYVIGIVSVRADLTYQQGLHRMWSRSTREDFYWPSLAHIGEQAVLNKEIYLQGTNADDDVFGYQERYAEFRYKPSQITGKMRSVDPQSLDVWHLSQEFDTLPQLNDEFIEEDPPVDRVTQVSSQPQFIFDSYFKLRSARPMPMYGVPGLVDHF